MHRIRIILTFCLLLLSYKITFSQEGSPLLTHFQTSREAKDQNWAICQDDNDVMLFANRRGILTYDGQEWSSINLPIVPFALAANPFDKRIYVGGDNNYGYIEKNSKGIYDYFSLTSDTATPGLITKIVFTDSTIYFFSDISVSRHRSKDMTLERSWKSDSGKPFTGLFTTPSNIFINVAGTGLYRFESDTLFPIVTNYITENNEILFSLPYDKKMVLLGTDDNKLRLFDGIKYYDYNIRDDGYIINSVLSEGLAISDSLYAFSTLEGGAVVIERYSGKLLYTINYQNGLPDDEIFATGLDNNNGLWLSHAYGLSRADLILPVKNFSIYPGLEGNLLSTVWYKNELYVGTSEGVFILTQVKNYTEIQVPVKVNSTTQTVIPTNDNGSALPTETLSVTRKSIFSRLFGKKSTTTSEEATNNTVGNSSQNAGTAATIKTSQAQTKKVTILKSINYIFKKIEGAGEKCKQMVATDQGILVATNMGLFLISDHMGSVIIKDNYINYISGKSKDGKYYIGTNTGVLLLKYSNRWVAEPNVLDFADPVYSIAIPDDQTIWIGTDDKALKFDYVSGTLSDSFKSFTIHTEFPQQYFVQYLNDTIFLLMESGISFFDKAKEDFVAYKSEVLNYSSGFSYLVSEPDAPWIYLNNDWKLMNSVKLTQGKEEELLKIFSNIQSINSDSKNLWVIDGNNTLYRISPDQRSQTGSELNVYIKSVSNEDGKYFELSDIVFSPGDDVVYFNIIAPSFLRAQSTQYQYMVEGLMTGWSKWTNSSTIVMPADPGSYTLHVRAKDIWENISAEKEISYTIKPPLIESTIFYIFITILVLVIILLIVKARERKLQHDKVVLEIKVAERTSEIEAQKKEITSSIEYASRIQMAMLPEKEHFSNSFDEHFIIFKPRDIVSGDFYWFDETDDHIFFTIADCTGHGVPGAFMSMLGISALKEITSSNWNLRANQILDMLREKIKNSLHQTGKEGEAADGMDMALCILHKKKNVLEYAGAYIPIYLVKDGQFTEYKADRMPIGIYHGKKESFTNNEIKIAKGDIVYFLSDGFIDQFGGPEGVKFKRANIKKLLSEISTRSLSEQKKILTAEFEKWKGSFNQVDDVTVIGVKI